MSDYNDLTFEEKVEVAAVLAKAAVALFVPVFVAAALGLNDYVDWFQAQPGFVEFIVYVPLWALSYVVVAGVATGLLEFAARLVVSAQKAINWIARAVSAGLTLAFYGSGRLVVGAVKLVLYPPRIVCEAAWDKLQLQRALWLQAWHERQEKRRLYREEFRDEFRSFRDFERHFENADNGGGGWNDPEPEPEPEPIIYPPYKGQFEDACRTLGLPENGSFTQDDLKKSYRAAMRLAHPDVGGSDALAVKINFANTTIKRRKGWS